MRTRLFSGAAGTPALVERRTALMERRTPALTARRATTVLPTARRAAALNLIYCDLIRSTQETIRYYRQLSDDRRRQNRRVSVKSDIVGNHLYQTAAGWTWARLIQDGKALLAVDEDNPDRIVSTDKKALQLGGRQVALDGQPVRPTDEVNVAKKYQLIALE